MNQGLIPVTNEWGFVNLADPSQLQILESIHTLWITEIVAHVVVWTMLSLLIFLVARKIAQPKAA